VRTPPWTIALALAHALAVERTQSDELLRESQQRQARKSVRSLALSRRLGAFLVALAVVVSAGPAAGAASATVAGATPTYPIPADAPLGPPQFQAPPAAGATAPPADQIADPVTPSATCGGWHLQSDYANRWPAGSSWWEYQCAAEQIYSVTQNCTGACDAFCTYCYVETWDWTDYFYWDGSQPVFYGEAYSDSTEAADGEVYPSEAWWDAPTKQWYALGPFPLGVSIAGAGSGNVRSSAGTICDGCTVNFDAGMVVTLVATPDAGSVFAGWSGDCSGTGSCQVTMSQGRSVTATFAPNSFLLSVSKQGTGSGQVSSSPGGISCRSGCQASFGTGTVVTLTATPDAGSVFAGWSGDCSGTGSCQVTMNQARSVVATFAPETFGLTVSKAGSGSGQVSSSPAGISCGSGCQASFDPGTVVTLTATPGAGSVFAGWSGDCSGTGSCQVTISQARSVTATFAPNLPPRASFTLTCTGLNCTFDGGGSSDPDDPIASFAWNFGDGSSPLTITSASPVPHTYPKAGSYTVTLTVTDNAGATGTTSKAFNPISVSARGYRQNGAQKVGLAWNGASGTAFDVYRNGSKVASLQAFSYTDTVTGKGSFTYKVCVSASSVCSNTASVSF
jgi:PKD repeat protein